MKQVSSGLWRMLGIADADRSPPRWHVSPPVDVLAYALSWMWVLVPMLLLGSTRTDYLGLYLLVLAATYVHRHFGLPYVYMDSEIRSRYPIRFYVLPAGLIALWLASPWLAAQPIFVAPTVAAAIVAALVVMVHVLRRDGSDDPPSKRALGVALGPPLAAFGALMAAGVQSNTLGWVGLAAAAYAAGALGIAGSKRRYPARLASVGVIVAVMAATVVFADDLGQVGGGRGIHVKVLLNAVAVLGYAWNVWHVHMQKYGIMRLYNAKSGAERKVPGWVDRLLILAWLPLVVVWLVPQSRDVVFQGFRRARGLLPAMLDTLEATAWLTVPIAAGIVVVALVAFVRYEWRANRLGNAPRLWMAGGTTALSASFLIFDPVKVYLAFAFSHAIEYMVFVWAFQRRRYREPLPHDPSLGRALRHPWLFYVGFIATIGIAFLYFKFWGRYFEPVPAADRPHAFGVRTAVWATYWGIYQGLVHFYFDGFLWKMRTRRVRASI